METILAQGLEEMDIAPPPAAVERLCRYAQLLLEQNQVMNLTAITEPAAVARLHFLDSAGLLLWGGGAPGRRAPQPGRRAPQPSCCAPQPGRHAPQAAARGGSWLAGKTVVDVGTGAGFPGLVLKILEPSISLTLVDSLGKRIAWLERVCETLSLDNVRCFHARAEELALEPGFRDSFDAAASRAVAAFPALCELCLPYVKPGGVFLAMKSVDSAPEAAAGEAAVKRLGGKTLAPFDYTIPGTEVTHRLWGVEKLSPTPSGLPRSWGRIKRSPL